MDLYKRNIYLFYAVNLLYGFLMGWGVIHLLFLKTFVESFTTISILFSVLFATILLLEVPTGAFSDLYGRKKSLIISIVALTVASLIYGFFSSIPSFFLAIFLLGVGITFWSGSEDAIIFESLKKSKEESKYREITSRNFTIFIITGAITNFLMPIIFETNVHTPFLISSVFGIIIIAILLLIKDITPKRTPHKKGIFHEQFDQIKKGITVIKKNRSILWLVLFTAFWGMTISVFGDLLNQPLVENKFSLTYYGIIFSIASIIQATIVGFSEKIMSKLENIFLRLMIFVWFISLLIVAKLSLIPITLLLGIMWSIGTFNYIYINSQIQHKLTKDNERATVISLESMAGAIILIISVPIWGVIVDKIGLESTIQALAWTSLIIGAILLLIKKKFQ